VLVSIPAHDDIRKKSANYQIIGTSDSQWGPLFAELAEAVATAPPVRPTPLDQDGLLGLFKPEDTGGNFTLKPASQADMRGGVYETKPSLEVVYDNV